MGNYAGTMDGRYVTLETAQTISGDKTITGVFTSTKGPFVIRMTTDTSNYKSGLRWESVVNKATLATIAYHNTARRLFLHPLAVDNGFDDKAGNYALKIGVNELTYNTNNIWHAGNSNRNDVNWISRNSYVERGVIARSMRFNNFLAYYDSGTTSTVTGTICITLPNGWTSSMNIYEIVLYEYNDLNCSIINIGAYNFTSSSSAWHQHKYNTKGNYNKGVRLAYNGSKCVILLGNTTTTWSYPKVFLRTVYAGHSKQNSWDDGYTISVLTNESGYTNIVSPGRSNEYFGNTSVSGLTVNGGSTFNGHLLPGTNASFNIGAVSQKWNVGYFTNALSVNNSSLSYATYGAGYIELSSSTPFIDFHFNGSTADYTSRIIEQTSGRLTFTGQTMTMGNAYFGGANYWFTAVGDISARTIHCRSLGNDYSSGAIEVMGNGTTNTIYPNIGFHQPGKYASSLQLRAGSEFYFRAQGDGGNANVNANLFRSTIPTGTAPYSCSSTTLNANLNADLLDGLHAKDFPRNYYAAYDVGNGYRWVRLGYATYPSAYTAPTFIITLTNQYNYTRNCSVSFIVSLSHGKWAPIITQLNGEYGYVSIVRVSAPSNGSYGYRYVDVYCNTSTEAAAKNLLQVRVQNLQESSSYFFILNQSYVDGTSLPANYEVIGSFSFAKGLGTNNDIKVDGSGTFTKLRVGGYNHASYALSTQSFICNSWIRSVGATGWYNETYAGGWYMADATWIRAYNGKPVLIQPSTFGYGAASYNVGLDIWHSNHCSLEVYGGSTCMGLGAHSNGTWNWWYGTGVSQSSTAGKRYVMIYNGTSWSFTGNLYATGAITAMQTSDYALKHNFDGTVDYRSKLLKLGRVYDYNYNDKALRLYEGTLDKKRHTGLIYQNAKMAGITGFCHDLDKNGYGGLNYLSPDLMATVIGAVQANILSIRMVENEQERIRKELAKAKAEIEELKRELAHRGS